MDAYMDMYVHTAWMYTLGKFGRITDENGPKLTNWRQLSSTRGQTRSVQTVVARTWIILYVTRWGRGGGGGNAAVITCWFSGILVRPADICAK